MTERQVEQQLRTWYRAEASEGEASPLLAARVHRIPEAFPVTSRRITFVSNTLKFALAGAAALFAGAVGIGLYFSQMGGVGPAAPSPSPTLPPTPVEIAEAYIEARNAHDPERARELLADGFSMDWPPVGNDLGNLELAFEMHEAFGFNYSDGDCREGTGGMVTCDYLWTTEVHRISGLPPTPTTFNFYFLRDGRISRIGGEADAGSWYGPFYDDFLEPEYPEFSALLAESFTLDDPEAVREVSERLPGYFELYEEWLSQQP